MSDSNPIQLDELKLTDDVIIDYLHDNPDFFNRNPELINSLRLADQNRGTVSLVERQQSMQRQKIHGLEEEITQLMAISNQNEQLFALYSDLYLRLLDCNSADELLDCLYQAATELLSLSGLKVWLKESTAVEHKSIVTNDCAGVMNNRLAHDDYYFGRLQKSEQQLIFSQHQEGSVVLIKLNHLDDEMGFLAISSTDANHFDPRMDTLLLSQFRKLVAKLLFQQLSK